MQPFSKHSYFAYLPTVEFGPGITSATEIRTAWPTLNPTRKTAMVMSLYPATKQNPQLAANVVKMMDLGMGATSGLTEDTSSSSLPDVLYHGGENLISKFKIPPYGVFFSPHKDWAENYGDEITTAKVNATKVYVADSDNWNDPNSFDAKVLDALFDRDYKTLAVCIKVLMRRGYQALQTQTDSEMVVAFPGTEIQVIPPDEGVELKFNSNSLNESQIYSYFKKKYSLYESEKFPQRMVSSIKKINETDNHNEIKQFIHRVETFDYPGRIKVGDSLAVLDFEINFAWKEIEGRGFTQAKRITKISADGAGINYIEFEDGDRYPRLAKATFGDKQRPMEFAAYFKKSNDAEHAITVLGLIVPDTWEYSTSEIQRGNTSEVDEQFTTNLTTESEDGEWGDDYEARTNLHFTNRLRQQGRSDEEIANFLERYWRYQELPPEDFKPASYIYPGYGAALKVAKATGKKVVKSAGGKWKVVNLDDPSAEVTMESEEDPQLSKPIKPFNQVKQYPLTALL